MSTEKLQFNYQSVIEASGLQNINIEKKREEKDDAIVKLQEQIARLKKLTKDTNERKEYLAELKSTFAVNLQKVEKIDRKLSSLNRDQKIVQEEISQLNLDLQQKSDDFIKKNSNLSDELKDLYSQFEGETLTNTLGDLNAKLLAAKDIEAQLLEEYEDLKKLSEKPNVYERPRILKGLITDMPSQKEMEDVNKKLVDQTRNIECLSAKYNKTMEAIQRLS